MSGRPGGRPAGEAHAAPAPAAGADSVDAILDDWARERPDLDFSPVGVVTRLGRVRSHVDGALAKLFAAHGLSAADFQVVVTLRRQGRPFRLPQSRLMTELALTSGTISVRIDRLTRAGVVTRTPDPDDGRGSLVTLTAHGAALFDELAPLHLANEDRLLSALDAAERDLLADLLRKLLASFESPSQGVSGAPLGLRLEPAHVARERRTVVGLTDVPGLLVADLVAGSAAARAGLAKGDLLVAAGRTPLLREETLADVVAAARPGSRIRLSVLRGNDPLVVSVAVPRG